MFKYYKIQKEHEGGFTLLLSLLVTSAILVVGFAIFDVVTSQMKFSQIARDSQLAFYASDTGLDCAYYWDNQGKFATSTLSGEFLELDPEEVECAGQIINQITNPPYTWDRSESGVSRVSFKFSLGNNSCAFVRIEKNDNTKKAIFRSTGYNNSECSVSAQNAVKYTIRSDRSY